MMLSFGLECTHAHTHIHLLLCEKPYHWKNINKKIFMTEDRVKVRLTFHNMNPFELRILSYVFI